MFYFSIDTIFCFAESKLGFSLRPHAARNRAYHADKCSHRSPILSKSSLACLYPRNERFVVVRANRTTTGEQETVTISTPDILPPTFHGSLRFRFSTLKRTRSEENTEDANSPEFSFRVLSSTYRKQNPIELFVRNELERAPMKFSLKEIQLRLKTVIDSYEYNL